MNQSTASPDNTRECLEQSIEIIDHLCPEYNYAKLYHVNTFGQPMNYEDPGWDWMLPFFLDRANKKVFMAAVQCGKTDLCLNWAFTRWDKGLSGAYVLPTKVFRDRFIDERVDPLIARIPYYKHRIDNASSGGKKTDNKAIKRFGDATAFFLGSNVDTDFFGFTAQFYIIDELDKCTSKNLKLLNDRISSTRRLTGKEPEWIKIGNPSIAGQGIHEEFKQSDEKYLMFKCEHCNEWQALDWFVGVVNQTGDDEFELLDTKWKEDGKDDINILCRKCHRPLDRFAWGEWVAEHPGREVSGCQISKLFTNQTTIAEMYCKNEDINFVDAVMNQTKLQQFYNSELGLPYEGRGDKLGYGDLDKCVSQYLTPMRCNGTVAGVDVGKVLHVRIDEFVDGHRRLVFVGTVPDFEELERSFIRFGVDFCIIDALPETHKVKEFLAKFRKGLRCYFTGNNGKLVPNLPERKINVDRTEQMDSATSVYMKQKIIIPANYRMLDNGDWVKQMFAPTRILNVQRTPAVYEWQEGTKADHHRLADCYCNIAATLMGWSGTQNEMIWLEG